MTKLMELQIGNWIQVFSTIFCQLIRRQTDQEELRKVIVMIFHIKALQFIAKITLHIKFAILINNTSMKNFQKISNCLKLQICDFLWSDFQSIFVITATDHQPKVVATVTDHQPKVMTTATDFRPILVHYVHFAVSALNCSCSQM